MASAWDMLWESELDSGPTCRLWYRTRQPEKGVTRETSVRAEFAEWRSAEYPVAVQYDGRTIELRITCPVAEVPRYGAYVQLDLGQSAGNRALQATRLRAAATVMGPGSGDPVPLVGIYPAPTPSSRMYAASSADSVIGFAALLPETYTVTRRRAVPEVDGPRIEVRGYKLTATDSTPLSAWLRALDRFDTVVAPITAPGAQRRARLQPIVPFDKTAKDRRTLAADLGIVTELTLRETWSHGREYIKLPYGYLWRPGGPSATTPQWGLPSGIGRVVDRNADSLCGVGYVPVACLEPINRAILPPDALLLRHVPRTGAPRRPLVCIPETIASDRGFRPGELDVPAGFDFVTNDEWHLWHAAAADNTSCEFANTVATLSPAELLPTTDRLWLELADAGDTAIRTANGRAGAATVWWGVIATQVTHDLDAGLLGAMRGGKMVYGRFVERACGVQGVNLLETIYRRGAVVPYMRYALVIPTSAIEYVTDWAVTYLSDAAYAKACILRSKGCPGTSFFLFPGGWDRLEEAQASWDAWFQTDNSTLGIAYRRDRGEYEDLLRTCLGHESRCVWWHARRLPLITRRAMPSAHTARIPRRRQQAEPTTGASDGTPT